MSEIIDKIISLKKDMVYTPKDLNELMSIIESYPNEVKTISTLTMLQTINIIADILSRNNLNNK